MIRRVSGARFFLFLNLLFLAILSPAVGGEAAAKAASATAMFAGSVYAVAASAGEVYVGGSFTSIGTINANNIAKYNRATNTWSSLGGGLSGGVNAIVVNGSDVYVGGRFISATNPGGGTVSLYCIARWSNATNTWSALGVPGTNSNGLNGDINSLAIGGGYLYAGGSFTTARNSASDTLSANSIARWDGTRWGTLGTGSGTTGNGVWSPGRANVSAIVISGSDVYAGGSFTKVQNSGSSSLNAYCIAKWSSATGAWAALGKGTAPSTNGVAGDVLALTFFNGELIVGGTFSLAYNDVNASVSANKVVRWNGTAWTALGSGTGTGGNGVNGTVYSLATGPGYLYVGGDFESAYNGSGGGIGVVSVSTNNIARWNGQSWSGMGTSSGSSGNGANGFVNALSMTGSDLFAGGVFTRVYNSGSSSVTVDNLARWSGTQWAGISGSGGSTGGTLSSVSAASFGGTDLSAESMAAAFGTGLATATQSASTVPLPTSLAGTTVRVRDSLGTERLAPLFFVSAGQINYLIPAGTAAGAATVTVVASDGKTATGNLQVSSVSPGLFSANATGQGVASATALRLKGNGAQSYEPVARFDSGQNRYVSMPIDIGTNTDQVFLVLFGSGFRNRSSLVGVVAQIGGTAAEVLYAGSQGGFVGLDQLNIRVPRSLAGRGEVDVIVLVDGKVANTVRVNIK
ncbi:MAG: hypothetical protein SF339_16600 [Blastocatellia bacterium]|nr:hypothetical protein [Blastocatellia bacterium]